MHVWEGKIYAIMFEKRIIIYLTDIKFVFDFPTTGFEKLRLL